MDVIVLTMRVCGRQVKDINSELSFNVRRTMKCLFFEPPKLDAYFLHKALEDRILDKE